LLDNELKAENVLKEKELIQQQASELKQELTVCSSLLGFVFANQLMMLFVSLLWKQNMLTPSMLTNWPQY